MTDAEWLAARPEIVKACDAAMNAFAAKHTGTDECSDFNMTAAGLAAILPLIRREIIAELAGEAPAGDRLRNVLLAALSAQYTGVVLRRMGDIVDIERAAATAAERAVSDKLAAALRELIAWDDDGNDDTLHNTRWMGRILDAARAALAEHEGRGR